MSMNLLRAAAVAIIIFGFVMYGVIARSAGLGAIDALMLAMLAVSTKETYDALVESL